MGKVGEFIHQFDQFVREVTLKTETGCTKGDLGSYDTDGFAQAGEGDQRPFVVFRETVAAPDADQSKATAAVKGCITLNKLAAGAIAELQYVKAAANGKVTGADIDEDTYDLLVARAIKAEASGATTVDVLLE